MRVKVLLVLLLLTLINNLLSLEDLRKVYIVFTENNKYYLNLAENLKENLAKEDASSVIHLSLSDSPHIGSWTILPIVQDLLNNYGNSSWFIFLHDNTHVDINLLNKVLQKYHPETQIWIGHSVFDREPSITHHFDFDEGNEKFTYPISGPGFAISNSLMKSLAEKISKTSLELTFSIDFVYELSKFIWDNGNGVKVTHEPSFCPYKASNCSTYPIVYYPCKSMIAKDAIYFAVKTYHEYHTSRLPVVRDTWAKHTSHIGFFSDVTDKTFGTISTGVANSEKGHCNKTMKIIENVAEIMKLNENYKWMFLIDDDTILSVNRVRQFLSCFNHEDYLAIGERYGYGVYFEGGYNYLTGGAGILMSKALVLQIPQMECNCPSISSPDDMILGLCWDRFEIPLVHSPYFHQARPNDYTPEYLEGQLPITFHKYWNVDPRSVYKKWFSSSDTEAIKDEF